MAGGEAEVEQCDVDSTSSRCHQQPGTSRRAEAVVVCEGTRQELRGIKRLQLNDADVLARREDRPRLHC